MAKVPRKKGDVVVNGIVVIVPAFLKEMTDRLVQDLASTVQHKDYLDYVSGWIFGAAKQEYARILLREGRLLSDEKILSLLCELAVTRALVRWHEIRDRPPPMPSIDKL